MKPIAPLVALLVLAAGLPAAANPLVTVINETEEAWMLLSDLGHRIPGVLTATRSARDGAEGSGLSQSSDPARREALSMALGERDAVIIGMERPTHRHSQAILHLLSKSLHQFHLEFHVDTGSVPARATLLPIDGFFCPLDQDPYWLQVSSDGATVRIRRRSKEEAKGEGKADGKVEALADAASGVRSAACAIL